MNKNAAFVGSFDYFQADTHFNNNNFIIYVTMNFYEWKLAAINLLHTIAELYNFYIFYFCCFYGDYF